MKPSEARRSGTSSNVASSVLRGCTLFLFFFSAVLCVEGIEEETAATSTTTRTTRSIFHRDFREVLDRELNELLNKREEVLTDLRDRREKLALQQKEYEEILKQKEAKREQKKLQDKKQQQESQQQEKQEDQKQTNKSDEDSKKDVWPADRLDKLGGSLDMEDNDFDATKENNEKNATLSSKVSNNNDDDEDDDYEKGELQHITNQLKMLYFREQQINESEVLLHNTIHHLETVMMADNFTSEFTLKWLNDLQISSLRAEQNYRAIIETEQLIYDLENDYTDPKDKHKGAAEKLFNSILDKVGGDADQLEENLHEENPFKSQTNDANAKYQTVLIHGQSHDETADKGKGNVATTLIDSENNHYVLTRPKDTTIQYEDAHLIQDIIFVLSLAFIGGFICNWLKLPVFFGYVLAGIVLGPSGFRAIESVVQLETISELGVFFILFVLGLEFSMDKLRGVLNVALCGGGLMMVITVLVTGLGGIMINSPLPESIVVGCCLSLSSTAVILRCVPKERLESHSGHVLLGVLVTQDVFLGVMLALLGILDRSGMELLGVVLKMLCYMALFLLVVYLAATLVLLPFLKSLSLAANHEIFMLGVISLCFCLLKMTEYFGLSMEMGCFIAGLLISLHPTFAETAIARVEPVRDIFAALFFASIGLHVYPSFLVHEAFVLLVSTGLAMLVKFGIPMLVLCLIFRYDFATATEVSFGLSQIGEFAFVLASRGKGLQLLSREAYYLLLGTTALSLLLWPLAAKAVAIVGRRAPAVVAVSIPHSESTSV